MRANWMQYAYLNLILGLTTLISTPALAEYRVDRDTHRSAEIHVAVIDERGQALPRYPVGRDSDNSQRAYLAARRGSAYAIEVENRSPHRVGLVIAVDGRNILSGKRSELQSHERMYVLAPYQRARYRGWRAGRDRINEFYFSDAPDSYAGRWGDYSAMGVIAVAAFQERRPQQIYRPESGSPDFHKRQEAAPAAPGTGFGEERYDPSRQVSFVAESWPFSQTFLKYEWPETLCERGIGACGDQPNRFWEEPTRYLGGDRFVPPPPGRRR